MLFLSGLSWWSHHHPGPAPARDPAQRQDHRRELTEWLDRFVAHQHFYREAHGRFSKLVAPVGFPVPAKLGDQYEIQVTEAGPDRLRVLAQTDGFTRSPDQVTIDEGFNLKANFPIPGPRPSYLRYVALKTLRALMKGAEPGDRIEKTAFRHYFRYEKRTDSRQRVVATATGGREPVAGQKLELGPEGLAEGSEWAILNEAFGGEALAQESRRPYEQFTRKVFQGELGRAPDSPEELALFAGIAPQPTGLVTRDGSPEPEVEALQTPVEAEDRAPASAVTTASNTSKTQGNIRVHGLEIESVPGDN